MAESSKNKKFFETSKQVYFEVVEIPRNLFEFTCLKLSEKYYFTSFNNIKACRES